MNDFEDNDEYFSSDEVQELMADIAGEFLDDSQNDEEFVTLVNDDGEEVEFAVLGIVEYQGKMYIVLMPTADNSATVILELVPDEQNEENCTFAPVADELLPEIFNKFKEEHADEFNFE